MWAAGGHSGWGIVVVVAVVVVVLLAVFPAIIFVVFLVVFLSITWKCRGSEAKSKASSNGR